VCLHNDVIKIGVLYVKYSGGEKIPVLISYFHNIFPYSNAYVFVQFQTLKFVGHYGSSAVPSGGE
jgi:hypothetical protein